MWESTKGTGVRYKQRTYNIIGSSITGNNITIDPDSDKLAISTTSDSDSPIRKLKKINTPSTSVHQQLFSGTHDHSTEATELVDDLSEILDTTDQDQYTCEI